MHCCHQALQCGCKWGTLLLSSTTVVRALSCLAHCCFKQGVQGEGVDGDDDGDTEDGADNASGHRNRRAKIQAVQDDPEMQAVIANMAQMSPMEMMQMQSAGMMLPQQFWAGAMAAMDGHDADVSLRKASRCTAVCDGSNGSCGVFAL